MALNRVRRQKGSGAFFVLKHEKAPSINRSIVVSHIFDYLFHLETEASKRLADRPPLDSLMQWVSKIARRSLASPNRRMNGSIRFIVKS